MSIFNTIKSVFHTKKIDDFGEALQTFSPYMINRWLSFYDKTQAIFVNETLSKFHSIFENKEDVLNLYLNFIPKLKYKKIEYVKKTSTKKEKVDDTIPMIAASKEISQREVKLYMDIYGS